MSKFMDENYLLKTEVAKHLYSFAKEMPIIDYHCHLSPKEIYENKTFSSISEIWLGGDHYKWRLMRSRGIDEEMITGNASDYEKFYAWAKTLSLAIGNPLYEWSHLELKRFFDYDGVLDEETCEEVYRLANEKLKTLKARDFIKASNVEVICTTDDPIDDLKYHSLLKEDQTMTCTVLPTWRPDKVMNIEKDNFKEYILKLGEVSGIEINNLPSLKNALINRLDFFNNVGCRLADHGLAHIPCAEYSDKEVSSIFIKRLDNESLSELENEKYKTALLKFLMEEYYKRDFAAQLHYGVIRDNNTNLFRDKGVDVGGDSIGDSGCIGNLAHFLDLLDKEDMLPKTIIYSLNPNDNTAIDTVIACFQKGPIKSKLQHGSAWWFNDNYTGMKDQLNSLASQGYLAGFVGMLTDSRSFLSYARHEYFRRVLCDLLGDYVEGGRYPNDEKKLKEIVENITYKNAKEYFNF